MLCSKSGYPGITFRVLTLKYGLCLYFLTSILIGTIILFPLFLGSSLHAAPHFIYQIKNLIKGNVSAKETGKFLSEVTVSIKGKHMVTTTDANGEFSLDLKDKDVLQFSLVGFKTVDYVYHIGQAEIFIQLETNSSELNQVVVTALGISRSKRSLSYSTQKIDGGDVNRNREPNFLNTLSGKVAGLAVSPSASGPGSPTRIVLRGNKSITGNNNALIVVDGVAIDNTSLQGQPNSDSHSYSGSDGASNINPDDIESINVLKGPAGAALYGSRAANGAIIITTKSGKNGRMVVDLNSGITVDHPSTFNKLQNEYSQGNSGTYSIQSQSSWGEKITGQQVTDYTGKQTALRAYPNNIKDFFRNGIGINNSVAVHGGSDKTQVYFSYANNYNNGILPLNTLLRHTFDLRVNANITDKLSVNAKITYILQEIADKPAVGSEGAIVSEIQRIPRTVDLGNASNYKKINSDGTETQIYWAPPDVSNMNPYWTLKNTHHDENRDRILGLITVKYNLFNWLNIQTRISSDSYHDFNTQIYANNTNVYASMPGGYYSEENNYTSERNIDLLLSGDNKINKDVKITYNLGGSILTRQYRMRNTEANGLSIVNKFDLGFATHLTQSSYTVKRQLQGLYGTAQLSYKDFLYLDATARNDWSSTLPKPYSFFYPSIGLTGVLSQLLKFPEWISFSKIRGSYAGVGNDADPYLLTQTYQYYAGSMGGFIGSNTTKAIGNLKPELTTSFEVGTEWHFLKDRLGLDLTVYKTNSKNQLINITAPASSGYTSQYINAGNVQNTGFEIMLSATPIKGKYLEWSSNINFAKNNSKIIDLAPGVSLYYFSTSGVRAAVPGVEVGGKYGDLYGYKWDKTADGHFLIDANGLPGVTSGIERLGNYNPDFSLSWNNNLKYKNWNLGVLIDGRFGGVVTSGTVSQDAYYGNAYFTTQHRNDPWVLAGVTSNGTVNTQAITAEKFWTTVSQGLYSWGQFFTYDATNIRVREFSLSYTFKKLPKHTFTAAQLSIVGRNLFFLYRGKSLLAIPGIGKQKMYFDPEVGLGSGNYQGLEFNNLPTTRNFGLNVKLSF